MMKKILIIGTIASSMAFAKGFNNNNNMTTGQGMGGTQGKNYSQVANLTEAQQKELATVKEACKKAMAPLKLVVEEKNLAIKKELLNEKPDWTKVEGILKEKASTNSQIELIMLKTHNEIKIKFGITEGCSHMGMSKDMKHNMKM